jgi:hypothetical protein
LQGDDEVAQNLNFKKYEALPRKIVKASGLVWAFGRNKDGELGLGNLKDAG